MLFFKKDVYFELYYFEVENYKLVRWMAFKGRLLSYSANGVLRASVPGGPRSSGGGFRQVSNSLPNFFVFVPDGTTEVTGECRQERQITD